VTRITSSKGIMFVYGELGGSGITNLIKLKSNKNSIRLGKMLKFYHYNAVYEEVEIGHTTKLLIKVFRYKVPELVLEIKEKKS
jgi:hypothetical protein